MMFVIELAENFCFYKKCNIYNVSCKSIVEKIDVRKKF